MTNTESILSGPRGRAIALWATLDQIGLTRRMRIGFVQSSLMRAEDYIKFQVSCDGRRRRYWVIVKLEANDTYSVEFGYSRRFDWIVARQIEGVYADQLGEVVERLYVEVYS